MNKENVFLNIINNSISDNSYLGDDCAYLESLDLIVSLDTLIQDVHFKTNYFTPYELGKKALLVNISDILAGGGIPKYITVSISGNLDEDFIKEFYKGINEVSDKYNIKIIGGDLVGGEKISVSICILGDCRGRKISSRKNAKEGDIVLLKGYHGSSAQGLNMLLCGYKDKKNEFIKAHIEPEIYPEISNILAKNTKYNYAMMDTSDGLYDALNKISISSGVGFNINFGKIPKKVNDKNLVLFGGEDFGLLICLDPKDAPILKEENDLKIIGKVTGSNKILIDGIEIVEDKSFKHF